MHDEPLIVVEFGVAGGEGEQLAGLLTGWHRLDHLDLGRQHDLRGGHLVHIKVGLVLNNDLVAGLQLIEIPEGGPVPVTCYREVALLPGVGAPGIVPGRIANVLLRHALHDDPLLVSFGM